MSVDGPGDLRLALGGCEMVFSGEDVGWQVWFDGDTTGHDTDALVSQVAQQIQDFTGERTGAGTTVPRPGDRDGVAVDLRSPTALGLRLPTNSAVQPSR